MIIASQKRKENIAEYVLYMWQVEDLIRAHSLDLDKIRENVVAKFPITEQQQREMAEWYESLIDMMRREEVSEKGHLQMNNNIIGDLADLNNRILADPRFVRYSQIFYATLPYIVELRSKAGEAKAGEIETCFNALYGILMLRLQKKEISPATLDAANHISRFLAKLAQYYKIDEDDKLFIEHPEVPEGDLGTPTKPAEPGAAPMAKGMPDLPTA